MNYLGEESVMMMGEQNFDKTSATVMISKKSISKKLQRLAPKATRKE